MKSDRILAAAGTSFIGSHVVDALLESGHRVTCLRPLRFGPPVTLQHLKGRARYAEPDA